MNDGVEVRHYTSERAELSNMYPGKKWVTKVANMSDAQVHAVYIECRNRQEKKKKEAEKACKS